MGKYFKMQEIDLSKYSKIVDTICIDEIESYRFYPGHLGAEIFIAICNIDKNFFVDEFILKAMKRRHHLRSSLSSDRLAYYTLHHMDLLDRNEKADYSFLTKVRKKNLEPMSISDVENEFRNWFCCEESKKFERGIVQFIENIQIDPQFDINFSNIQEAAYWFKDATYGRKGHFLFILNNKCYSVETIYEY